VSLRPPRPLGPRRPLRPLAPLAAALAVVSLAACGGGGGAGVATSTTSPAAAKAAGKRLAGAPAALRSNAAGANTLVGEGVDGLNAQLAKLKGHAVVVNQWASWCGPCRYEFPFFSDAVVEHEADVAFVGIDFNDDRGAATKFLGELPPGFPSISDPKGDAVRSIGGRNIAPSTFFLGPDGKVRYTKFGGYPDAKTLEADIRRYAL
jgi:cytochrome c biogenesis protein CcmG/thiol:disulfide interchange protein DsbE